MPLLLPSIPKQFYAIKKMPVERRRLWRPTSYKEETTATVVAKIAVDTVTVGVAKSAVDTSTVEDNKKEEAAAATATVDVANIAKVKK